MPLALRRVVRLAAVIATGLAGLAFEVPAQEPFDAPGFVQEWCVGCHGGPSPKGDFSLEDFEGVLAGATPSVATLAHMRERLVRLEMPPPPKRQPPAADRARMIATLEREIAAASPPPRPRALRRLSRVEYENTIRDLLGVEAGILNEFPHEDLAFGFDNVADAPSASPILFEKALVAAERIARAAIVAEDPENPPVRRFEAEELEGSKNGHVADGFVTFYSNAELAVPVSLPRAGEYRIRAHAYATRAGNDVARLAFRFDEENPVVVAVRALPGAPEIYETVARTEGGARRFGAAFINDFFDKDHPDPAQRDRNLSIDWIEIVGPVDVREPPRGHLWITAAGAGIDDPKLRHRAVARALTTRCWRHPADEEDVERVAALIDGSVAAGESFERGAQLALQAALVSPRFLFRIETPVPADQPSAGGDSVREAELDGWQLASRLSYFIWSSMPDERLFRLAAEGRLSDPGQIVSEAVRLLRDARASALAENFAVQWLELRALDDVVPDPVLFPDFDESLRASARRESELLVEAHIRERRPLVEILDADFSFVDERLAKFYGIPGVSGPGFRRVPVEDARRRGLLGHASVHMLTSNPTRTSPVKRGKWILENLLDAPPPPPPPGVGALDERREAAAAASVRERLERHRADPACASCHARMDALGFALENFDAIGRWRERDGEHPIDASGTLPDGRPISGVADLRTVIASDAGFLRGIAKKLFIFALGRRPTPGEEAALDRDVPALGRAATFEDLVKVIVASPAFASAGAAR